MKIGFAGGGTGGHFYPIIAVAEEVNKIIDEQKLINTSLVYISTDPYDKSALLQNGITFEKIYAGKLRVYFSIKNFFDIFKTIFGVLKAIGTMYRVYPDVIFSKGAYASFPTVFAARILGIPVFIHESDSAPGRVNEWSGKFAKRIALSFGDAAKYFPKDKVAVTGQPIRNEIKEKAIHGMGEYFGLNETMPVIYVVGGSQGSQTINDVVVDALPELLEKYQVIHVAGLDKYEKIKEQAKVVMSGKPELLERYKVVGFLNTLGLKMAGGIASLAITRGGSSTIFELAQWGIPCLVVPIEKSNKDHQRNNAFAISATGGAIVIEEPNFTATILFSEIERIMNNNEIYDAMKKGVLSFTTPNAARTIAEELVKMAQEHEK